MDYRYRACLVLTLSHILASDLKHPPVSAAFPECCDHRLPSISLCLAFVTVLVLSHWNYGRELGQAALELH
ncbi:hypothetical protein STEG23_034712, partial [Scotinomys teguina]